MGVIQSCRPRPEVLKGDLADAIFAADFGSLIEGKAPEVYANVNIFFQNTHPAAQLKKIIQVVFERLTDRKEAGAILRLSTGFGGGKTHTLMALWHLAKNIDDLTIGTELLPAAGRPAAVTVVAIDAQKAGVPEFMNHGKLKTHSLWGEIFYQLGGEKALQALGEADHPESSPSEAQIEALLPDGPLLFLLDELVIYMAQLSERGQGNLLAFLSKLASISNKRPQMVVIVTDPAGQAAYSQKAEKLKEQLEPAAIQLNEILSRKVSDFDPIGEESARVITRRLFEWIDPTAAQKASAAYHQLYQRVAQEHSDLLLREAMNQNYAQRIVECYPFHPRLLDTARDRLGAIQDFQKSRGVLRLFARIIRDIWETQADVDLITAGDIDWSSQRIRADLLNRLNRDNFSAAISADIEKHAFELDGGTKNGIHRRVASALLLESLPLQTNSGMNYQDLTLAVLRPDDAGPEAREALDRLLGVCWHLYPMEGRQGWQFRYEENILKKVEQRKALVAIEEAKQRTFAEVQGYFSGPNFKLCAWPISPRAVPNLSNLQLVLCETEELARRVCNFEDDSDPNAPIPRRFRNAIVAVTAQSSALHDVVERARRLIALEQIEKEYRTGEENKLAREQIQRLKPSFMKNFRIHARRAFNRVVIPGHEPVTLEEKFHVSEEQILQGNHGQASLHRFLNEKDLIYKPGDALDIDKFITTVLPGTTPNLDHPEVFSARSVHERFLSAPGLRLIPDHSIVRQTIIKAVEAGKLVVRTADGTAYDAQGCVAGEENQRKRYPTRISSFALDDTVLITHPAASIAADWLKEQTVEKGLPEITAAAPRVSTGPITAHTWHDAIKNAEQRAVTKIEFIAKNPGDAEQLLPLAQPLGAQQLVLSVSAGGPMRDGGDMKFIASNVKPTHPAKPLHLAQLIFNSAGDNRSYEAKLVLIFEAQGRTGLQARLEQARTTAPVDIEIRAHFTGL